MTSKMFLFLCSLLFCSTPLCEKMLTHNRDGVTCFGLSDKAHFGACRCTMDFGDHGNRILGFKQVQIK